MSRTRPDKGKSGVKRQRTQIARGGTGEFGRG